jgi:HD-like signal output (HDOD) protein
LVGIDAAHQACISVQYLVCCLEALKGSGVPAKSFFRQSVLAGVAARRLGASRDLPPTFSFGLGLLHNAGTLAIAALHGGAYGMVYQAATTGEELVEAERAAFKIDHTQAGLGLLIYRGFDPRICEGAAFHHGDAARVSVSARLAAAGDLLALRGEELEARTLAASLMGVPFGPVDLAVSEVQRASAGLAAMLGA